MSLVDWNPAIEMALTGALLAALPLCWVAWRLWQRGGVVAWREPAAWRRALTVTTLLLVLDLVVFGAFTRLTDSGLGCPDWPGCYGSASPLGAHVPISLAQIEAPHGPVTHTKAWIEMIHRYLATMVGALITLLMGMAWWLTSKDANQHELSPKWAIATFVWVCAQGAFGAFTVTLKLYPLVVSTHLLGGLLGVTLLAIQAKRLSLADTFNPQGAWATLPPALQSMAWWTWGMWMMQSALGAWVSTNGAVLVCADFPQCQGQWWPAMDWAQGFTLLRHLGENGQGEGISLPALTAIHVAHRIGALLLVGLVIRLIIRIWQAGYSRAAVILAALLLWQVVAGLSNVILGWPILAALAHTMGAAMMVAYLMILACKPNGRVQGSSTLLNSMKLST